MKLVEKKKKHDGFPVKLLGTYLDNGVLDCLMLSVPTMSGHT